MPPPTVFDVELIDEGFGYASLAIRGESAQSVFGSEGGGHRWQRVPPTEKRGRVHTSTVTVAVMSTTVVACELNPRDVDIRTERGSGPGGQHKNKTDSKVVAVHRPTGISASSDGRSQHNNRIQALRILAERVAERAGADATTQHNATRRAQVGTGQRGDKVRTYRVRDDRWQDHRTGQCGRVSDWVAGR